MPIDEDVSHLKGLLYEKQDYEVLTRVLDRLEELTRENLYLRTKMMGDTWPQGQIGKNFDKLEFKLEKYKAAMEDIQYKAEGGCKDCLDWKDEAEHIAKLAREALKE